MADYQFDTQSEFINEQISVAKKRDDKIYNTEDMEHWTEKDIRNFVMSINLEILQQVIEIEYWMKFVLEEPDVASVLLSKFATIDKQITVKDACQLAVIKVDTVKKILKIARKYADAKHNEDGNSEEHQAE